jgi:threonine 3-dehydrogenase
MGADRTVNVISGDSIAAAREELGIDEGYGVCLEMSGAPACLKDIIAHSAYGGNISLLGIQPGGSGIDWNTFVWKGLKMKGIYGREMYATWQKMDAMLRSGLDVSPIITHRMHYTDFAEGFNVMSSGNSGKVVLTWAE